MHSPMVALVKLNTWSVTARSETMACRKRCMEIVLLKKSPRAIIEAAPVAYLLHIEGSNWTNAIARYERIALRMMGTMIAARFAELRLHEEAVNRPKQLGSYYRRQNPKAFFRPQPLFYSVR